MKKLLLLAVLFFGMLPTLKKGKLSVVSFVQLHAESFGEENNDIIDGGELPGLTITPEPDPEPFIDPFPDPFPFPFPDPSPTPDPFPFPDPPDVDFPDVPNPPDKPDNGNNPCDVPSQNGKDPSFKGRIDDLKKALGLKHEVAYTHVPQNNISAPPNYIKTEGSDEDATANIPIEEGPILDVLHSHPSGTLPIFSARDVRAFYSLLPYIANTSTFSFSIVAPSGDVYTLTIGDLAAFQEFGKSNLKSEDAYGKFADKYDEKINPSTTSETAEANFLKLLNDNKSGLNMFKKNPDDPNNPDNSDNFSKEGLDQNNNVKNDPCK